MLVSRICFEWCDNRTRDGVRWDQIAERLQKDRKSQPWPDAESLGGMQSTTAEPRGRRGTYRRNGVSAFGERPRADIFLRPRSH